MELEYLTNFLRQFRIVMYMRMNDLKSIEDASTKAPDLGSIL
jgi:hypothetical protein